jgi:sugar phosphate isomerase/epimerase
MSGNMTRREWGNLTITGLAALMLPKSLYSSDLFNIESVPLGVQTYSFRDRSLFPAIQGMKELAIKNCELWHGHVEPGELMWNPNSTPEQVKQKREELKKWRLQVDLEKIEGIRKKITGNGIKIQAYNCGIKENSTDKELENIFKITQALGTNILTTSATVNMMPRLDKYARKYKIYVGMHNHDHTENPNEFATPDSFFRGMKGNSEYIKINLDIGHFTASNYDPLKFISENHENIVCLHLKDRLKNKGPVVPYGEGDTPVAEILQLLKEKKWNIPANIEYEYHGKDTMEEMRKSVAYCRQALNV